MSTMNAPEVAVTITSSAAVEVQKFMTQSGHGFLHYIMVFNKKWFDAQPKGNQDILVAAMKEAGRWQRRAMVERDAEAVRRIKAAGVQVVEITPQARDQFRQLSQKVHEQFADRVDREFLQRTYAEIKKASK